MRIINRFNHEFAWLSNMYILSKPFMVDGITYKSSENYYQAQKSIDPMDHRMQVVLTPQQSKRWGRNLSVRKDWNRDTVMWEALTYKFQNNYCLAKLLATDNIPLIEGNTWGDTYWGVCNGIGQNTLGKMLMQMRNNLRNYVCTDLNSRFEKDNMKARIADSYIGIGARGSSTDLYRLKYEDVNKLVYEPYELVFVSINGDRPNRVRLEAIQEYLNEAIYMKACFVTDNSYHRNRQYNIGERELADYLSINGYTSYECEHYAIWIKE